MATKSRIAKIISGIIATTAFIFALFVFLPSFWFWVSFEIIAAILVPVGCAGEWWLHHHPSGRKRVEKESHHALESRFIGMVTVGVMMEFFLVAHTIREGIKFESELSNANQRVSATELQVASVSNNTVRLSIQLEDAKSFNLVLRSNVATLEASAAWRMINPDQFSKITNFFNSNHGHLTQMGLIPTNFSVIVSHDVGNDEAGLYAAQIETVFDRCGFQIKDRPTLGSGIHFAFELTTSEGENTSFGTVVPANTMSGVFISALREAGIVPEINRVDTNMEKNSIFILIGQKGSKFSPLYNRN